MLVNLYPFVVSSLSFCSAISKRLKRRSKAFEFQRFIVFTFNDADTRINSMDLQFINDINIAPNNTPILERNAYICIIEATFGKLKASFLCAHLHSICIIEAALGNV